MKKVLMSIMLVAGVYGLAFGQTTPSQQSQSPDVGWEKIGEKTVNLSDDSGIFNWNTDREKTINANEKYSAIKFRSEDATVNLTNVEVEYEDGQKQKLDVNSAIKADGDSKMLTLQSKDKKLDKVTFNFKKDESASDDKAKVELWGLKSSAGASMSQPAQDVERIEQDVERIEQDVERKVQDVEMTEHMEHNSPTP